MTIVECAKNLMLHFSPEERATPPNDNASYPGVISAVSEAMSGALQECYGMASPWVRWEERGALLVAPAAVSAAVTAGSTGVTITGYQSWMRGCAVVLNGHDADNRIASYSVGGSLQIPYGGSSGTVAGMVYQDSVTVADDVMAVYGPVRVNGVDIQPRPSADIYQSHYHDDYGSEADMIAPPVLIKPRVATAAGQPLAYWVETWNPSTSAGPSIRLRLGPANASPGTLEYRVMLKPPVIGALDSVADLPIPYGFTESIFMPIARQKLTACPFFRDQSGLPEINRAYQSALMLLQSLKPSKDDGIRLIPRF